MIRFACKQCGKAHAREDELAGTLVFCACGEGNRVPWSSTLAETAEAEVEPRRKLELSHPRDDDGNDAPAPAERWRPSSRSSERDDSCCLNHMDRAAVAKCAACGESFCSACCVNLQGQQLCGPCKDFRARALRRPPRISALAVASCALALLFAGPISFCLPWISVAAQADGGLLALPTFVFGTIAVVVPLAVFVLGLFALREIELSSQVSGRPAALTGTIAAGVSLLWSVVVYAAVILKSAGG
jgi:hypothetical protein